MDTWNSRRAESLGTGGAVSCDQPLASHAGIKVLEEGGTAADAAVAVAGVLSVLQPATCGLGGDLWALYYDSSTKRVHCLNGHGRTASSFTQSTLSSMGFADRVPKHHAVCTAVPGAPAALCKLHETFGDRKFPLRRLFDPAVQLARGGFPVSEYGAYIWRSGQASIESMKYEFPNSMENFSLDPVLLNPDGKSTPKAGQIFRNPDMARTLEELGNDGAEAFYKGRIGRAIVASQDRYHGLITMEDLEANEPDFVDPIKIRYTSNRLNGLTLDIYEPPPSSQGLVTLEALRILSEIEPDPRKYEKNLDSYYHALVESLRYSFVDLSNLWRRSENGVLPDHEYLLKEQYAMERAKLFDPERAAILSQSSFPSGRSPTGDTTYFCVTDRYGNGCSMVYSNYATFGTGYVPEGCGFTLNNRAYHFWEYTHRRFAPRVRPFSTLMAGIITKAESDDLAGLFGCMGGNNQPQAHLQILLNLLEFNRSPQQSLNRPRVMIDIDWDTFSSVMHYEEGIPDTVIGSLRSKGHNVSKVGPVRNLGRDLFGRGNVITCGAWWDAQRRFVDDPNVYWAACDPRSDGVALVL